MKSDFLRNIQTIAKGGCNHSLTNNLLKTLSLDLTGFTFLETKIKWSKIYCMCNCIIKKK